MHQSVCAGQLVSLRPFCGLSENLARPSGLCFDDQGNLYVTCMTSRVCSLALTKQLKVQTWCFLCQSCLISCIEQDLLMVSNVVADPHCAMTRVVEVDVISIFGL